MIRPSDIKRMEAQSLMNKAQFASSLAGITGQIGGIVGQVGGLYQMAKEAERVSEVNRQLAYLEQVYQDLNEGIEDEMFDVRGDEAITGPSGGTAQSVVKKPFGQASLSDIEKREDKFFQEQLKYITENTTNKKARDEMIQHLTMKNIQNKAIIARQWNVAAQHEAEASLGTLFSTILASNYPWEVKLNKFSVRVDQLKAVNRLWPEEALAWKEKMRSAAQYSFSYKGAMTVMKGTNDPAAAEAWLQENTPFYDDNPGVRTEIIDEVWSRVSKLQQRQKAARQEAERLGFLQFLSDINQGKATLEDMWNSKKYPLSAIDIKHFQELRDNERKGWKVQGFHRRIDELIERGATWQEFDKLEKQIYDAGLETSDLRKLTADIDLQQKALRAGEEPGAREKRAEYAQARALINAGQLEELSEKLTAKAYTSFDEKDDEYFWGKIDSKRKELKKEQEGDPMLRTDPLVMSELIRMFYDTEKYSNNDIEKFLKSNHGPGSDGKARLSNKDSVTWLDKVQKRSVYAAEKISFDMVSGYYYNLLQYEEDAGKILEARQEQASVMLQLHEKIASADFTDEGLIKFAQNLLVAPKRQKVGWYFSRMETEAEFEKRTVPERRELPAAEVYDQEMRDRFTAFKGAAPVDEMVNEAGETAYFDGSRWYVYRRRSWLYWDGKAWMTE